MVTDNNVLTSFAYFVKTVPKFVGHFPGAPSVAAAFLQMAATTMMPKVVGNQTSARILGGKIYKALLRVIFDQADIGKGENLNKQVEVFRSLVDGDVAKARSTDFWSERFQTSKFASVVLGTLNVIALIFAITKDDSNTIRKWADIFEAGTSVAGTLVFAAHLRQFSIFAKYKVVSSSGKALGALGSLASVVSGTMTAFEERDTGDKTGELIAWTGVAGGAMTFAGIVMSMGLGASATVAGLPVGAALILIGAVVGIVASAWGFIRDIGKSDNEILFETYLNHFGRDNGPYYKASRKRRALRKAFEEVAEFHHGLDFWEVHPKSISAVMKVGFPLEIAKTIVGKEDAFFFPQNLENPRIFLT